MNYFIFLFTFIFLFFYQPVYSVFIYKKSFDKKKQILEKIFYKDNKEIGKIVKDLRTQKVKIEGTLPTGLVKFYDPETGILREEVNYSNNQKNGLAKVYDKYGFLKQKSFYKDDLLNGVVQVYQDNKLMQEWTYRSGYLSGVAKSYDKEGNLQKVGYYKKNELNGTVFCLL